MAARSLGAWLRSVKQTWQDAEKGRQLRSRFAQRFERHTDSRESVWRRELGASGWGGEGYKLMVDVQGQRLSHLHTRHPEL